MSYATHVGAHAPCAQRSDQPMRRVMRPRGVAEVDLARPCSVRPPTSACGRRCRSARRSRPAQTGRRARSGGAARQARGRARVDRRRRASSAAARSRTRSSRSVLDLGGRRSGSARSAACRPCVSELHVDALGARSRSVRRRPRPLLLSRSIARSTLRRVSIEFELSPVGDGLLLARRRRRAGGAGSCRRPSPGDRDRPSTASRTSLPTSISGTATLATIPITTSDDDDLHDPADDADRLHDLSRRPAPRPGGCTSASDWSTIGLRRARRACAAPTPTTPAAAGGPRSAACVASRGRRGLAPDQSSLAWTTTGWARLARRCRRSASRAPRAGSRREGVRRGRARPSRAIPPPPARAVNADSPGVQVRPRYCRDAPANAAHARRRPPRRRRASTASRTARPCSPRARSTSSSAPRCVLKAEGLQRVGAFKFRGAYNAISSLSADELAARRAARASSGNHAQAVALAARLCGTEATILMPHDAPAGKRAATRGLRRARSSATTATPTIASSC